MSKEIRRAQAISVTELQRSVGKIMRRVAVDKERLIVERDGYPVAVILPYEGPACADPLRDLVIRLGQEAERQGLTEEQLMAELEKTKREVFEEAYGPVATFQSKARKKKV